MRELIAQVPHDFGNTFSTPGTLGQSGNAPTTFERVISGTIGLLTVVASIYFIFILITGAISWMSSGGDKGKIEDARQRMMSGVLGLVIVVVAIFIVKLVGVVLGLPNILNPAVFINNRFGL